MRLLLRYISFLVCSFVISTCVWAQESSITGSVRDASNAVIPNATVAITSAEQGFTRTVTTNASGDYLVSGLQAGHYNIVVTAPGFQHFQIKDLVLRVAEKARADATLSVGQVSSEVTVAGTGVSQVQTESAELSGIITTKQINQLVLNGRNFTQLITLVPGVSNQTGQDEGTVGVYGNVGYSVNGGRTEYNNWELDGGDNMDNGSNNTLNVYPNVDAIAEVKVLTSNYGAQYGRNGSATIETITKSGTQQFHGDLFEFVRNNDFNARNFFQPTVPEYKKNDYGFTIGGPVFIPKFYNTSKQKTFFFYSQEWRKEVVPQQTFNQQVPSNAERSGNFSDVCPATPVGVNTTAYPNCPVNPATGSYFSNNTVPVTPQAQAMLPLLPQATSGSGANSFFISAPPTPTNWREELVRVDQNISDKERFFFRYIHDSWNTTVPTPLWDTGSFPTVQTGFVGPGTTAVANLTSTLSPTLLNEFVFSYTADHIDLTALGPVGRSSSFDMPGIYQNGYAGLLPNVTIQNTAEYGGGFQLGTGNFPWNNANPTYTYKDNITKIIGGHNLTIGAYFVAAQKNEQGAGYQQGSLTFDASNSIISTGNGFADFLMGQVASFSQTNQVVKYYNRYKILEPYIQDDWHVNKKLTLNLGVRVSLFGTYREKYHQAYNWESGVYNPANIGLDVNGNVTGNPYDGIVQCGVNGAPAGCMTGHLFNPAPRFGFAYDPTGEGKTAIRGGYGVFFEHTNGNEANTESLENSPPLSLTSTIYNIAGYPNVAGSSAPAPLSATSIPTKAIWPYVQQWSFSIQHEFPSSTAVTVAYAGSKGTHLTDQRDFNQIYPVSGAQNPYLPGQVITSADCSGVGAGTPFVNSYGNLVSGSALNNLSVACGATPDTYRPYLGFSSITGLEDQANSSYNALQLKAVRTVGALTLSLAYTWSHSIDDSSDRYDATFVNSYNLAESRASSNFDQRQLLNISYVYDFPFFKNTGLLHSLLGGWQWSGLFTYQTGTPFSVTNGLYGDNAGVGNGVGTGSYVDVIGNPNIAPANPNVPGVIGPLLYNPAAFADPTGLTFGNAGRNILNNPSRWNIDMGLFKHFAITESKSFEFRAEAFNIFNHTQWANINGGVNGSSTYTNNATCYAGPNNSAGDPSCIASGNTFLTANSAHNPRILQLGLKFIF